MPVVSVASFNLHWGLDRHYRPYDVVEACRVIDADVLLLQESFLPDSGPGDADRAASELGYSVEHHILVPGRLRAGPRKPHIAVRTRRPNGLLAISMLRRVAGAPATAIELGGLPFDNLPRRGAQRVDIAMDGACLAVVGTHMSHISHGSVVHMARLRRQLPPTSQAALLGGDMNMWGPMLSAQLPGWRRAVRGRTWPSTHPHSQIDHLMVTPPVEVLAAEVVRAGSSDHLPVRAELRFGS